ncbi:MAG: hypothetical protein H6599_02435 [Flavobacteriales bacterium]|nr:hypothetical protein [Flavobacteriales bacterium]
MKFVFIAFIILGLYSCEKDNVSDNTCISISDYEIDLIDSLRLINCDSEQLLVFVDNGDIREYDIAPGDTTYHKFSSIGVHTLSYQKAITMSVSSGTSVKIKVK